MFQAQPMGRFAYPLGPRFNVRMPELTRRRYPERPDCWHVYYGDVHVGTTQRHSV
jgi:hypothetical protein